tara:strand:- start:841 stop:1467 length:627 start_codon:yes stop_codon:yes gene_type:complete
MDDQKKILSLFSIEVSTEQVGIDKEELKYIKNDINEIASNGLKLDYEEPVITSYHSITTLQHHPEFETLANTLTDRAIKYAEKFLDFDIENFSLNLNEMWFQIYKKGMYHPMHNHGNILISGAYYIQAPKNSADFIIRHPIHYALRDYPRNKKINSSKNIKESVPIKPETDMLILFPGWLDHRTSRHTSDEDRIMISCNWSFRKNIGK